MNGFQFIHAADLHLGSPFKGLRSLDKTLGRLLAEATFSAWDNIVRECLSRNVDFLLVAGDVFDEANRGLRAQLAFRDGLSRLAEAGIPSFVVHGNHDPLSGWSASLEWPGRVKIFGSEPEAASFSREGETLAHIVGASHPRSVVRENIAAKFKRPMDSPFCIGLVHANVGTNTGHEPYAPCTMEDLEKSGMDYWALGHVHTRAVLREKNPAVVYPGNSQGLHINEPGAHGVYLVSVSGSEIEKLEFIPTDLVRWRNLKDADSVDISNLDTYDAVLEKLGEVVEDLLKEGEGRGMIARIALSGRTSLHRDIASEYIEEWVRGLRDEYGSSEPFFWVDRIVDNTRFPVDLDQRREAGDFIGDLLKLTLEMKTDAEKRTLLIGECTGDLYGSSLWPREIGPLDADQSLSLVQGVENLLLDELLPEDEI